MTLPNSAGAKDCDWARGGASALPAPGPGSQATLSHVDHGTVLLRLSSAWRGCVCNPVAARILPPAL